MLAISITHKMSSYLFTNSDSKKICMRHNAVWIIPILILIATNCSRPEQTYQHSSQIQWEDLQATPQPNGTLCLDVEISSWDQVKRDFTYGLLGSIYSDAISETREIGDGTLSVNPNKPQTLNLRLWYPEGNERPAKLRMFVLLDDKQINDVFAQSGFYNDIILNRGSDTTIPLKIPPLAAGVHDLIAIAVPYPEDYPVPEGIVKLVYWRITLIAEAAPSPFRKTDFISLPAEGSIKKNGPLIYLELTLKKDKLVVWNWPNPWLDIDANNPIEFFALAGHSYVENLDAPPLEELKASFFSLLFFIDYQQIEIAPDQMAIYGKVDKDTAYASIPIMIDPLPKGKHYMLVLRIDSPGVPMCILRGDPKGRIIPNSIYGKLVGINVLPPK